MLIYITSIYKCGSTNIFNTFKNNMFNVMYEEYIEGDLSKNSVIKFHTRDNFTLKNKIPSLNYDLLITCIRNPLEVYISAYFQNLFFKTSTSIDYPYYLGNENNYLDKNIDFFIDHFKSFEWTTFKHLDYEENAKQIEEIFGLNYLNLDFDYKNGYSIYENNGKKLLVMTIENTDYEKFKVIMKNNFNIDLNIVNTYRHENNKKGGLITKYYDEFKKTIMNSTFYINDVYYKKYELIGNKFYGNTNYCYVEKKNDNII